jgi:hypothetical protein
MGNNAKIVWFFWRDGAVWSPFIHNPVDLPVRSMGASVMALDNDEKLSR